MTDPKTPVWKSIAETLEGEIAQNLYRAGDKLPTEAELSARFGVNRHTVRHALGDMSDRGLLRSRRGAGVFVESPPTDYPIGKRVRFHQNILATGRLPEKRVLRLEVRPSNAVEARALDMHEGEPVLVYEGLSLSGDAPIAHFTSIFPQARLPGLEETLQDVSSVTEALKKNGIADYIRRDTRVSAELASPVHALHLRIRQGDPLLKSVGVNTTLNGVPVEFGITRFAGERVTLTMASD